MSALSHLRALKSGAAVWRADDRARVQVRGADARAFLHRLSTNHVGELGAGQGRLNAFLTDKGRVVDVVVYLDRGAAGVMLLGGRGRGAALVAWLDRYLFSEDVALTDASATGSCAELAGAGAPALVEGMVAGAGALERWSFVEARGRLVARGFDHVDIDGTARPSFLVVDLERPGAFDDAIAAGAAPLHESAAEALRVAAGIPGVAGELVDAHNPLELALHDAIHWAKGCYTGQEVIARLDSYAKVGKRLAGLVLDEAAAALVRAGDAITSGGQSVGVVTSVSPLHNGARPSALALLKSGDEGAPLQVRGASAVAVARAAAQAPHG
ncbi:MAG: hypothetical protein IT383_00865 [Deltaproteobacteria bacterium]|nr:hypothetical protein [Deltaproteobacteria bacterium]